LIFSILEIFNGRFLVKLQDKNIILNVLSLAFITPYYSHKQRKKNSC